MVAARQGAKSFRRTRVANNRLPEPRKLSPEQVVGAIRQFAANLVLSRSTMAASQQSTLLDPPGRNLAYECGYPANPGPEMFRLLHRRNGLARRCNDALPDECFAVHPEIYETEDDVNTKFEQAVVELSRRIPFLSYLHRADRLSGIGRFGVILIGINDGKSLASPVDGVDPKTGEEKARTSKKEPKVTYLTPFAENFVKISATETDELSPRFTQPTFYELTLGQATTDVTLRASRTVKVHWTRIVHLADNREESDLVGTPRLEPILDYLLDLRKIGGGSAEMFWKAAFPGFSFETLPDLVGESVMDEESVREQLLDYMNGLQRYLALDGVTAKPLLPQAIDPTNHARQQLELISATIGIPMRYLLGSEASHQASTQDTGNWNKKISERQRMYLEPFVIRPFIDRLILMGVLPKPVRGSYQIAWRDLNTVSDSDRALITLQRSQAMMQYMSGGCEAIMPVKEFLTLVMGFTPAEAQAIMDSIEANKDKQLTDPLEVKAKELDTQSQIKVAKAAPRPVAAGAAKTKRPVAKPQGGGRNGRAPRRQAGRPAQKTPRG